MALGARRRVTTCSTCGATVPDGATWCGACGDLRDAGPLTTGAPPRSGSRRVARGRAARTLVAGALAVGAVAAVLTLSVFGGESATTDTVLGRVDDATGRSSVAPPPPDAVRRWAVPSSSTLGADVVAVEAIGDGLLLVGDRMVQRDDGTVLGPSTTALPATWGADSPDGLIGLAEPGRLRLVDPLDGATVEQVDAPALDAPGAVVGWADGLALVVVEDGGGARRTIAVGRADGRVRWTSTGSLGAPVGEGWSTLRRSSGGTGSVTTLIDDRTGGEAAPPSPDVDVLPRRTHVVDGVVHSVVRRGAMAWDADSRRVLWRQDELGLVADTIAVVEDEVLLVDGLWGGDVHIVRLDRSTGRVLGEDEIETGASRAGQASSARPRLAVGRRGVLVAAADGLVWAAGGDRAPVDGGLDDVIEVRALDPGSPGDPAFVAVAAATVPDDSGLVERLVGGVTMVVYDEAAQELLRVDVRPTPLEVPRRIGLALDGLVVIGRGSDTPWFADTSVVDTVGGLAIPPLAALERWLGEAPDAADAVVLGTVPGSSSAERVPIVWRRSPHELVLPDGATPLRNEPVPTGSPPVVVDHALAIPVVDGVLLQPLPPVPGTDSEESLPTTGDPVLVEGARPVAAVDGLLLAAVDESGRSAARQRSGTLVGLDAATGDVLWRSGVTVSVAGDPTPAALERGLPIRPAVDVQVLHAGDGPAVVVGPGVLVGLDTTTGDERWRVDAGRAWTGGAVLADRRVVVATATGAQAYDVATGAPAWSVDLEDRVTAIDAAGSSTLLGTARGEVVVLDREGAATDVLTSDAAVVDDVAVVDGVVVVAHVDGAVVGFGAPRAEIDTDDRVDLPRAAVGRDVTGG